MRLYFWLFTRSRNSLVHWAWLRYSGALTAWKHWQRGNKRQGLQWTAWTLMPRRWRCILPLLLLCACSTGCTVVSANRVFPKLDWYWSKDAKEQRREEKAAKEPLPGGHTDFIPATPDTTKKVMAMRMSSVKPPMPPLAEVTLVEGIPGAPPPHAVPQRPLLGPSVPDPQHTKEEKRLQAMHEAKRCASGGILYAYEVKDLNHFFDAPDNWTAWLIQCRGPQEEAWTQCGQSTTEPTRGCTVAGREGFQYRLVRTAP